MAELINEIISPEAFKQVADMKAELASLTKQMEDMLKKMNNPQLGGKSPFLGVPEEIQRTKEEMRQLQIVKNKIITTEAKLNDEYVQQAARLKELNSELRANVAQTGLAEGSLDQMRNNLNKLEKLYSAMSAEMRNAKVGQTIFADMVKAKEGVTLLEQSMGNYKRNVGNYQNSTFQLTQTLRELPAFAFSAQTGLMGISNNLPMLADGFQKVAQATNESTGKVNGFFGALKIFGKSLFSFTNLFGLAIAAVTMFAPAIASAASSMKKTSNEADDASKSIDELNNSLTAVSENYKELNEVKREGTKNSIVEREQLKTLYDTMTNTNKSMRERVNAMNEIRDKYPQYFKGLKDEEMLAGKASLAYQNLANDILKVAKARAAETKITKIYEDSLERELDLKESMNKAIVAEQRDRNQQLEVVQFNAIEKEYQTQKLSIEASNQHRLQKKQIAMSEYNDFMAIREAQTKALRNFINTEKTLLDTPDPKTGTSKTPKTAIEKRAKENVTELEIIPAFKYQKMDKAKIGDNGIDEVMNRLPEQISKTPVTITVDFGAEDKLDIFAQKALPIAQKIAETTAMITGSINDLSGALFDREMADLDAKQKKQDEYYQSQIDGLNQLSISEEERKKRISALDAQKAAQDKKIEAEKLQAARKRASVEKAANIANIITTTALAVIKAWVDGTTLPGKIAGASLAGIAGSISLAAAIAAPLPQFAKGTDNAPEGFAVVGERGTELVVNPDGSSWLTPAKDTITYLKQGAKVIPNNELMDMVKYANYVNVGGIKQGETGGLFGMALVSKFDELADEVRGLKMIMANKNMNVQVSGNYDHYLHVRKNIR